MLRPLEAETRSGSGASERLCEAVERNHLKVDRVGKDVTPGGQEHRGDRDSDANDDEVRTHGDRRTSRTFPGL